MTLAAPFAQELDPQSFRMISDIAYRECGLILSEEKSSMICSRLRSRLRALGLPDFRAYCGVLQADCDGAELRHLISALTTNVSHFFRENHHFETMRRAFDACLSGLRKGGEMRIWSAGCSNGQEAFSIAMTLLEHAEDAGSLDIRILGTDIDPEVIAFARTGRYPERLMRGVPEGLRQKYFSRTADQGEPVFAVEDSLRRMVRFNELNLLAPWPMTRSFDLIFCRNVVIYFDMETQAQLWPRMAKVLGPDGTLFLGHSERIADPLRFGFECTGPTTYRHAAR